MSDSETFTVDLTIYGGHLKKVEAICMFRYAFGTSLAFSKDYIEKYGQVVTRRVLVTDAQLGRLFCILRGDYDLSPEVGVSVENIQRYTQPQFDNLTLKP